jgi:hypothetical protein
MHRESLLEPIISSIRKGTQMSRFGVLEWLVDWDVVPLMHADEHIATAVIKGTEIHFAAVQRPKGSCRGMVRAFLQPLLEERSYLTTRVRFERNEQMKFVQRVGFKPTWKDQQFQYFLLGDLPFTRK